MDSRGSETKTLTLIQFRNYHELTVPIAQHTVFIGPNGVGKTNILEAVRTLSVAKSYRVDRDRDTIEWNHSYCRIVWEGDPKIEFVITVDPASAKGGSAPGGKKVMKRDGVITPLNTMYGTLPTVLFSPETMELVTGSPQERRRFLDTLLCQADSVYLDNLLTYRKVLRERHFVLLRINQGLGANDELDFWDQELIRTGGYIMEKRTHLVEQLNQRLVAVYPQFLTETHQRVEIRYEPTVELDQFTKKLHSSRNWDIKSGSTRYGPHRDELRFILDDRDITLFASRGEIRSVVLATKLAEADYLAVQNPNRPILLLDDVFSELDATRRQLLLNLIAPFRSIITTTDEAFVATDLPERLIHHLPLSPQKIPAKPKKKRT